MKPAFYIVEIMGLFTWPWISSLTLRLFPLALAVLPSTLAAQQIYQPEADPRAAITSGQARFTVLTPQMIRLEWSADGQFEDRPSFVVLNRRLPVPAFTQTSEGKEILIRTDALELRYTKNSGKFTPANLSIRFTLNGERKQWVPGT